MDQKPFFQFNILDYRPSHVDELSKFRRDQFDLDKILTTASTLKYSSAIQREFAKELDDPSEEMVRLFVSRVYEGRLTKQVKDDFKEIVTNAFKETIRELVNKRLTSALEVTSDKPAEETQPGREEEERVVTTRDEIEAFHIVKSIVRMIARVDRITMRDAKSYCAILLDNNNRKPIARLHFDRATKYIGLFTSKEEERIRIDVLVDIYNYEVRIQQTVQEYLRSEQD